jgi:DNA processing protein
MEARDTEWAAWLALKMVRGVGNIFGLALVRAFGTPQAVLAARAHALACAGVRPEVARAIRGFAAWAEVERQLAQLDAAGGRLVTWLDASYPEHLRHIHDPPLFLFVQGDLRPADALAVALVGSRAASAYGRHMTAQLSEGLARQGVTIVSGLARGIDAVAHGAALRAGGRTIAVLGCGIDVNYPSEHHQLQMNIARTGAVVSEFPMGTPPDAENFPGRNRIISGLALGTVVVEANEKSGSLITARYAAEQGREVFAVPGPVGARSAGAHRLLREGATLVERAEDILDQIAPHRTVTPRVAAPLDGADAAVFAHVADAPTPLDAIITGSGLPAASVLEALLRLELQGLVQSQPGGCVARAVPAARRSCGAP